MAQVSQSMTNMQNIEAERDARAKAQRDEELQRQRVKFLDLPDNVILQFLNGIQDPKLLCSLAQTCRSLRALIEDNVELWEALAVPYTSVWHNLPPSLVPLVLIDPPNFVSAIPLPTSPATSTITNNTNIAGGSDIYDNNHNGISSNGISSNGNTTNGDRNANPPNGIGNPSSATTSSLSPIPTSPSSANQPFFSVSSLPLYLLLPLPSPQLPLSLPDISRVISLFAATTTCPFASSSSSSSSHSYSALVAARQRKAGQWRAVFHDRTRGWRRAMKMLTWLSTHGSPSNVAGALHRQQLHSAMKHLALMTNAWPGDLNRRKEVVDTDGVSSLVALLFNDSAAVQDLAICVLGNLISGPLSSSSSPSSSPSASSSKSTATCTASMAKRRFDEGSSGSERNSKEFLEMARMKVLVASRMGKALGDKLAVRKREGGNDRIEGGERREREERRRLGGERRTGRGTIGGEEKRGEEKKKETAKTATATLRNLVETSLHASRSLLSLWASPPVPEVELLPPSSLLAETPSDSFCSDPGSHGSLIPNPDRRRRTTLRPGQCCRDCSLRSGWWLLQEYSIRGEAYPPIHLLLDLDPKTGAIRGRGYDKLAADEWRPSAVSG
eukprot:CAMPEP_0175075684 /NCGR_PEP_ID=MMETSP0052_2-20121109/22191_1 /TAXON_ID=51329 ORGANISM="Polytomella parva, Strain SAG 63-3" /NCGR_SAMPLE_ID=MMETSP0052_2 /ASSEMBLY_ACC=CAM_ASM_000194 /LENGTH=612 /DNA_ID=CAMNT_0016344505 /DNA_START=214 /DNA_END=2049 /DNA_ORIENTATION=-